MTRPDALAQLREAREAVIREETPAAREVGNPMIEDYRRVIWDRWHAAVRAFWEAK